MNSDNFSRNSVGLIELSSIAMGYQTIDAMLKAANVELVISRTICPGKYIGLVWGDVAAVEASVQAGLESAQGFIVNSLVIPNLHSQIFPALTATNRIPDKESLGVVETFDVVSSILAADASVKAANVTLCELRIAMAIGGKGFYTITGDVAAVEAAVEAGKQFLDGRGQIVYSVVIPNPSPELFREYV
ncbi:MAG: BMC domain-containing protein [Candidatus Riflebacteria bacterium]|nr:BMC domain-containing protein [Candidatus Riflebacteria bacterium]